VQKTSIIPFFDPLWVYRLDHIHKNFSFVEQYMDQIKLYNILRTDLHLSDDKAADFVSAIGKTAERGLDARIQTLATKDDIRDLYKIIYLSGLVQFIAIVASVLAIVKFMR
jgi:hypothetical protein